MQPRREYSLQGDDEVIVMDSVRRSPGKRQGEDDQANPRPTKRQTVWVEVPPRRKKALSVSVKQEPSSPEVVVKIEGVTPTVKRERNDHREASSALSVIRNVSFG